MTMIIMEVAIILVAMPIHQDIYQSRLIKISFTLNLHEDLCAESILGV